MRNFLFKLFSINWNLFKTSKEKNRSKPALDSPSTKRSSTQRKIIPLDRSAVEIISHFTPEENVHAQPNPYYLQRVESIETNNQLNRQPLPMLIIGENPHMNLENLGKTFHATRDDRSSDDLHQSLTESTSSSTSTKDEFHLLPFDTGPSTKELYNEMNIRELVNTVRSEIGELIDADQGQSKAVSNNGRIDSDNADQNMNTSATKKKKKHGKKSKKKSPPKSEKSKLFLSEVESKQSIRESTETTTPLDQCNKCCCNFLHYSLRQIMRDSEQIKQFALNTSMIGLDPSKLRDPTNTLCSAICLPMYNCEYIGDQRFPMGPTFTTISKNELNQIDDHPNENRTDSMIIQTINTHRGPIQIRLDPQSFGLSPFFSDQYESFIKGPPTSIFSSSYINTYHR